MNKKNKFKLSHLFPIPFFFAFIAIGFLEEFISELIGETQTNIVMIILLAVIVFGFIGVVGYVIKNEGVNSSESLNAKKIKALEPDIYGHYARLTNQFTFLFLQDYQDQPQFIPGLISMDSQDRYRLEHFVVMIVKHPKFLQLYKHGFETLNHSDGKYFQLMHIYSLYYLLENDITKFTIHYRQFKDTISLRTESRVLGEKLHRIRFGKDFYDIPVTLIELMYEYYVLDKAIDHKIFQYRPKCRLDELIYTTILYYYLGATENDRMQSDVEEEYIRFKEIRNNL